MRKSMKILGLLTGIVLLTPLAAADMSIQLHSSIGSTGGGAFNAQVVGTDAIATYNSGDTFQTFCVEHNEYIAYNTTYDVILNENAVNGGVGGGNPDPLDKRTAYLFSHFTAGTLTGYNGSAASADALQNAIWYIEQEVGSVSGLAATFVSLATAEVTSGSWWQRYGNGVVVAGVGQYADHVSSLGNVRVLNLYDHGFAGVQSHRAQDQLVTVPAPGAVLLGAIGLGLIRRVKRHFA